jgi:hypothetical protein
MQRTLLLLSLSLALPATAADLEWPHLDDWQDGEPKSVGDRTPSDQELNAAYKQRLKERRRVALQRRYAKYGRKSYNRPPTYFPAAIQPRVALVRQVDLYRPVSSCRPSRRSLRLVYHDHYRH